MNRLLEIGFRYAGHWKLKDGDPVYELTDLVNHRNILYAFASEGEVKYIGKTTKPLRSRMYGYQRPGPTQSTNIKNNLNIRKLLSQGKELDILALPDEGLLHYGVFHISLSAGLEDSLISIIAPEWNAAGTSARRRPRQSPEITGGRVDEEHYRTRIGDEEHTLTEYVYPAEKAISSFAMPLRRTYREKGFFNVPLDFDRYLGEHGQSVDIYCGEPDCIVTGYINRKSNPNGTARVFGGAKLRDWLCSNFKENETIKVEILSVTSMAIRHPCAQHQKDDES